MTAATLKLSDLAGPDAAGWADVAVFVRADGDGEQFVVLDQCRRREATLIHKVTDNSPYWSGWEGKTVRRLGRGRLEPARIVMEGEAPSAGLCGQGLWICDACGGKSPDLAAQVATLRAACSFVRGHECEKTPKQNWCGECYRVVRAALAATAPTPRDLTPASASPAS